MTPIEKDSYANMIIKIDSIDEKKSLKEFHNIKFIDSNLEVGNLISKEILKLH
jgi:hypothetical protein